MVEKGKRGFPCEEEYEWEGPMKEPTVAVATLATQYNRNLFHKIDTIFSLFEVEKRIPKRGLTAVKLHFGEEGNTTFIRPIFLRRIVENLKRIGARPFLTDTCTLYVGERSNGVEHLALAIRHGFSYAVVDAPLVIADGIRGNTYKVVPIEGKHFQETYIAKEIVEADAIIGATHFKAHDLAGIGGTLKNIGMGCASRMGKLAQHSNVAPKVKRKRCVGCGTCVSVCAQDAISITDKKAHIDAERCVGCGECIPACPQNAIQIQWNETIPVFQEKLAEYATGALKGKRETSLFFNFVWDISPVCDCTPHSGVPIAPSIGIVASTDPVAVDQASVDLICSPPKEIREALHLPYETIENPFEKQYPRIDWTGQLRHAERMGLGVRTYRLLYVDTLS